MELLKNKRRPLRSQLTKTVDHIENELGLGSPNRITLKAKIEMAENYFQKVQQLDQEIFDLLTQVEFAEEELDTEMASAAEYEEKYRAAKLRVEDFLAMVEEAMPGSSASSSITSTAGGSLVKSYKLPKIELKKFNGEYKEWLGFWAQFKKVHEDEQLHDSDKFQYLVQSMVVGTRADRLVASYPQSEENYQKVVAAMMDRFGDKVLLTELYVRELLKMVVQNVAGSRRMTLADMYDELESYLHALESLGVSASTSAAFLYPLVESSLPEEIVKVWQRSSASGYEDDEQELPVDDRLKRLMKFLKREVKGAERLTFVKEGLGDQLKNPDHQQQKNQNYPAPNSLPTATALVASHGALCIFCEKQHDSQNCMNAQTMPFEMKKRKILKSRACLGCLRIGHNSKVCRSPVKCLICGRKHVTLMCQELQVNKRGDPNTTTPAAEDSTQPVSHVLSQLNCTSEVLLQTLRCVVQHHGRRKTVRMLLDPGSQRSYILDKTAQQLNLKPKESVRLCHLLFGGTRDIQQHRSYEIELHNESSGCGFKFEVLGHKRLCDDIPKVPQGPWLTELKRKGINITDAVEGSNRIDILVGSDYYGELLTGRRVCIDNGLVALETVLGWTLSGRLKERAEISSGSALSVTSLFVSSAKVRELYNPETTGIHDPIVRTTVWDGVKARILPTIKQFGAEDGLETVCEERKFCAEELLHSFCVDNCVTSVSDDIESREFTETATEVMEEAKMELRQWACTVTPGVKEECNDASCQYRKLNSAKVLGLNWDIMDETLPSDVFLLDCGSRVNKWAILLYVNKIFHPIWFARPVTMLQKLLLQEVWSIKIGSDQELPESIVSSFKIWCEEATWLKWIRISRDMVKNRCQEDVVRLNTFCDANKDAYADVVYFGSAGSTDRVSVQMLLERSRVAPVKRPTIPCLELLACVIGARRTSFMKNSLSWIDSSTALTWIQRNNTWETFVGNRVEEIGLLSEPPSWRHIPGTCNPVDLPSTGCRPSQLLELRWWEWLRWLNVIVTRWPSEQEVADEDEFSSEQKHLSQLIHRGAGSHHPPHKLGDVVLDDSDDKKRLQFSMARIIKILSDRDETCRVAKGQDGARILGTAYAKIVPIGTLFSRRWLNSTNGSRKQN